MKADDPRHGEYAGAVAHWSDGERPCDECARAEWRYRKTRKMRHLRGDSPTVASRGVIRRIQALHALGWTGPQIAERAGISVNSMRSISYHGSTKVRATTAAKIVEVYELLSMTRPEGHYANRARSHAARRDYAPPLAWDDIDNDEAPHVGRDSSNYRADELAAEWDHLREAGVSIHTAATQLGVSVGAIEKAIERTRKVSAA